MHTYDKIRTLREQKQLTQEDVAERLFMSVSGYSKIERGETRLNMERLEQIADVLDIDILELISKSEGNVIYALNSGYHNFQNTIYHNAESYQSEIDRLNLIITHKDELLAQKEQENQRLQDLIDKLTQSLVNK
ncbi:helix-turn-helix domain-containing protein [Moraxella oblonga]|uniref:helix-turn-helix domain-containing protein n=1 Tax=Moraxella oblonga TaxID=200413 RepID=UPI00082E892F|nr:helix-turn-helix domain-containing protein [Moraxella oblonga]